MLDIKALPPELLLEIFSYMSTEELLDNVQHVCKKWRRLVRNMSLWEHFVYYLEMAHSFADTVRFVENCPMLKHIHVYIGEVKDNCAEEFVSTVIRNCSDVRTFCVEFGQDVLTLSHIDAVFEAFPDLEFFKIVINSQNAVETVDRISKCYKLKKLIVKSHDYCGSWLRPIADGCISLEYLKIWCSPLPENEALYILENMKDRLTYLRLPFPQPFTQKLTTALGSFLKLEDLKLFHHRGYGEVNFTPLASIKTLKCIEFQSDTLNIDMVKTMFGTLFYSPFPLLVKLAIDIYCCDWDRCVLQEICRCYPKLKFLCLDFHHRDTKRDTFEDISRMGCLDTLEYRSNTSIRDIDVEYIAQCRKLKHLDLKGCGGLTDRAVVHIAKCRTLESVELCYTSLTGHNLHLLNESLARLKSLQVFGTKAEREVLSLIAKKMPLVDVYF